jgi:hypothetical protein
MRNRHKIGGGVTGRMRRDLSDKYAAPTQRANPTTTNSPKPKPVKPEVFDAEHGAIVPQSLIVMLFNPNLGTGLGIDGSIWICEKVRDGRG